MGKKKRKLSLVKREKKKKKNHEFIKNSSPLEKRILVNEFIKEMGKYVSFPPQYGDDLYYKSDCLLTTRIPDDVLNAIWKITTGGGGDIVFWRNTTFLQKIQKNSMWEHASSPDGIFIRRDDLERWSPYKVKKILTGGRGRGEVTIVKIGLRREIYGESEVLSNDEMGTRLKGSYSKEYSSCYGLVVTF